jgi:hypothetical protein
MRQSLSVLLSGVSAIILAGAASAQAPADAAASRPGRDPRQPIDSAYTAKIREYTTESLFV